MANSKSARKRIRQRAKRHLRNRQVIGTMRAAIKNARNAVDGGDTSAGSLVHAAIRGVDRAVSKGVIKRNAGSRLISRLSKRSA